MPQETEPFNPNNPYTQVLLLAQRVDNLGREKEDLEKRERELDVRLQRLEVMLGKEKMDKIESAILFMDNAQFMSKWSARFIGVTAATITFVIGVWYAVRSGK